jgi:hypothetical protein
MFHHGMKLRKSNSTAHLYCSVSHAFFQDILILAGIWGYTNASSGAFFICPYPAVIG